MREIKRVFVGIGLAGLLLTSCSGSLGPVTGLFNRRVTPVVPVDVSPKVAAQLRDFDFAVQSLPVALCPTHHRCMREPVI